MKQNKEVITSQFPTIKQTEICHNKGLFLNYWDIKKNFLTFTLFTDAYCYSPIKISLHAQTIAVQGYFYFCL